jgi:DNA-binding MarR family transcriptional regulator
MTTDDNGGRVVTELTDAQYQVLLVFRSALRRYLQWSAEQAAGLGLTPQQHQLLLAVRAHPGATRPSIGELSEYLLIRHHSTVELVNRVESAGLVVRALDPADQRVVRVQLTEHGQGVVDRLSEAHMSELRRIADLLAISEDMLERLSREFAEQLLKDMHEKEQRG